MSKPMQKKFSTWLKKHPELGVDQGEIFGVSRSRGGPGLAGAGVQMPGLKGPGFRCRDYRGPGFGCRDQPGEQNT